LVQKTEHTVCIVIPAYQGGDKLLACLSSVFQSERAADLTIVVDNASTDGSVEEAERRFTGVEFVRNPSNRGFGSACNQGIEIAMTRGMDYVLTLNQDARIEPGSLSSMLNLAEREVRAASVGNKTLYRDTYDSDRPKLLYNGSFRTRLPLWQHIPGIELAPDPDDKGPRHVDYVWGHAMLLRTKALVEVGAFDEQYFMYYEDIDLCHRFLQAGWQNWCDGDSVTWHDVEDPSRTVNSELWRWRLKMESSLHFHRKYFPALLAYRLWLTTAYRHTRHFMNRRQWTASWHTVAAVLGVMAGISSRPG
jgi:N-acetylglucosaminyl-diphospho-decaprenol L-rhamnosyltransferase